MPESKKFIEKLFDTGHRLLDELAERWQKHTNRRTVIVLVLAGIASTALYLYAIQPPDSFPLDTLVSVPEGESLKDIAATLQQDGVIRSPLMFRVFATLIGEERSMHAGDYLFKEPLDVFSIVRALGVGAYGLEPLRIRVPEGATTAQMAVIFDSQLQRFNADNFLTQATPQEGYLFPDTYFFLPNANENTVIQALRQNFDGKIATIAPQIASSTHSLSDIVTMASILEREAYNTKDRRMIAGVLWNRIARGMPLQSDVTLQYVVHKPDSELTRADLQSPSPYNTYMHKGLPPTPVDSPSLDSLLAAATPIKSDYLYYLADKRGVTHYSKTYQQHLQQQALYLGT